MHSPIDKIQYRLYTSNLALFDNFGESLITGNMLKAFVLWSVMITEPGDQRKLECTVITNRKGDLCKQTIKPQKN